MIETTNSGHAGKIEKALAARWCGRETERSPHQPHFGNHRSRVISDRIRWIVHRSIGVSIDHPLEAQLRFLCELPGARPRLQLVRSSNQLLFVTNRLPERCV